VGTSAASRLDSLPEVEAAIWRELALAAGEKSHPWRLMILCTAGPEGWPDGRAVVLRELQAEARTLVFFSDARAAKLRQVADDGRAVLVLWSSPLGWQLRLRVRLTVETSGLAVSSRWARLKMSPAAQDYLSPLPPGSDLAGHTVAPARSTREHFAVVAAAVESIDWLELHAEGHRRARFDAKGARWLAP
jgi:pyridoxamine 5'-phosphate oxidase